MQRYIILYLPLGQQSREYLEDLTDMVIMANNKIDAINKFLRAPIEDPEGNEDISDFIRNFIGDGNRSLPRRNPRVFQNTLREVQIYIEENNIYDTEFNDPENIQFLEDNFDKLAYLLREQIGRYFRVINTEPPSSIKEPGYD